MNRLLVPTDFSHEAENALKVASILAKRFNSEIILLHVIELPLTEIDALSSHSALPEAMFFIELAKQKFNSLLQQDYLQDLKIRDKVLSESIFTGIATTVDEENIDLIIMGSHGASGFKELFVGSNAEKVVRTSKVPVMVIKREEPNFNVKNFVFASDFKDDNINTYRKATELAELFNAQLHLVIVALPGKFNSEEEAANRVKEFIEPYSFSNYSIHIENAKTVESGILSFSNRINADLIGISTHGRQGISHFLNGSIGEDVANHALRPVITFRI